MLPTTTTPAVQSLTAAAAAANPPGSARPLAPPEVHPFLSDEEEEEEESDVENGEDEDGHADLVAAVEHLLGEVEVMRKSSSFPSLDALSSIDKAGRYLGPTMESNWVLPGRLLVGAYPASMNDSHHAHLLCTILLQGVSTFVCLQQEYRAEGVTEEMWRSGDALRPYFQDVLQLLTKLRELRRADPRSVPAICAPEDTDFVHFPIVDCNVADDTKVLQLAAKLAARLARGEVMYLHCWGGHGRTGTVVCIMLHLMYGLSADEAMERCQHVHDVRRIPISVGSPQTEAQRQQVRRVIAHVISHRRSLPPTPATPSTSLSTSRQQKQQQSSSSGGGASGGNETGSGGANGAVLSPESCKKRAAGATSAVGGRRAWVRGHRQAFAQAPNGVGEDVSGWLPSDNDCEGEDADGFDEQLHQHPDGIFGNGKKVKAKWGVAGETGSGNLPSAMSSGALALSSELEAAASASAPRRKSFSEPYSEEDPSRGTRMGRARRKSAPGKPPADVLAARADASPAASAATVAPSSQGKEDLGVGVPTKSLPLSPANRKSRHHSTACSLGGADASVSPGSCTGVERCAKRSSGGGAGASCRAR